MFWPLCVGTTPLLPTLMALWRTDDALLGVAALTHVMTVLLRFLENPHRASILALNRTRSRRRLAAKLHRRMAQICSWSTEHRSRGMSCCVYLVHHEYK